MDSDDDDCVITGLTPSNKEALNANSSELPRRSAAPSARQLTFEELRERRLAHLQVLLAAPVKHEPQQLANPALPEIASAIASQSEFSQLSGSGPSRTSNYNDPMDTDEANEASERPAEHPAGHNAINESEPTERGFSVVEGSQRPSIVQHLLAEELNTRANVEPLQESREERHHWEQIALLSEISGKLDGINKLDIRAIEQNMTTFVQRMNDLEVNQLRTNTRLDEFEIRERRRDEESAAGAQVRRQEFGEERSHASASVSGSRSSFIQRGSCGMRSESKDEVDSEASSPSIEIPSFPSVFNDDMPPIGQKNEPQNPESWQAPAQNKLPRKKPCNWTTPKGKWATNKLNQLLCAKVSAEEKLGMTNDMLCDLLKITTNKN